MRDGSAVSAGAEKLRKLKAEARCPDSEQRTVPEV